MDDGTIRRLRDVADLPDLSGTRYEVVERVASGGMGVVYRARDRELDRDVAMKVLDIQSGDGDTLSERMLREARILARLEHPGIVPVHDVGVLPDGRVFYTMKLVRGQCLDEYAETAAPSLSEALRVFGRICEAVAFAHSHGVIHRDLKPRNVMVGAFGEVLVMDWGVARVLDASGRGPATEPSQPGEPAAAGSARPGPTATPTAAGTVLGTPGYMSPEQERGEVDRVGARSDVYSLGAILRYLVHTVGGEASPARLRAIYAKAMAGDLSQRYETVEALGADVSRFVAGVAVRAYREGPWERARRLASRYRLPIGLVLAYLVMRILLFLFTRN